MTYQLEQYIKYFKIRMEDHNAGSEGEVYENIVSIMVCPYENPARVTLEQASADASSTVSILYGFEPNSYSETLWNDTLSQSEIEKDGGRTLDVDLPPGEFIRFKIETDFNDSMWGFGPTTVTHLSNTSFAKVFRVEEGDEDWPDDSDIVSRLKVSFEDLPLEQVKYESDHLFDYNDAIFYFDILRLGAK